MSIFTTFAKQSMINRLSNAINRNRSAAKISKVMSSNKNAQQTQELSTFVKVGGKQARSKRIVGFDQIVHKM